jgi:MFS family permease
MAGVFVGNIVTGPLADSMGRKPSLIISELLLVVFNAIAYFIQTWEVYAVIRFLIGIGSGIYFTVAFPLMVEFVPSKLRPIAVCFPSEPIAAMLFAFVSFWLHDWRSIHLLKTLIGIPILMTLW